MFDLMLNGKHAVLKTATNFKFNVDNQVFSEQGSYSHEVVLPLLGCRENSEIFGIICRSDVPLKTFKGSYVLISEVFVSSGIFKILEVDDEEVKIQLLARKTKANYNSKDDTGDKLFIDELPLGDFYDEFNWYDEIGPGGNDFFDYPPKSMSDYAGYLDAGGMWRIHAVPPKTNCVNFPIISSASTTSLNIANIHKIDDLGHYVLDLYASPLAADFKYRENIAFQPQILEVVKRIFKQIGFTFTSELGDKAYYTFIANSRCHMHYASILPHWTINEFMKEVCNFFDAVLIYDDDQVRLIKRNDLFKGAAQEITEVVDEFTAQYEDEAEEDFSASGNVDYEWPRQDDMLRLPDEVWESAEVKEFANFNDLQIFAGSMKKSEKEESRYLLVDRQKKRTYAFLQNDQTSEFELSRVDWYAPLIRDKESREIQTSLRIVPVRMEYDRIGKFMFDFPAMIVEDTIMTEDVYSVNNAIKPDSEAAQGNELVEKRDVIEVFYYDGSITVEHQRGHLESPIGVMVHTNQDTGLLEYLKYNTLNQDLPADGPYLLQDNFKTEGREDIDTQRIYQFKFLKKGPIDINQPFIFHGRKFICKQLQYDCSGGEVSPMIFGYFFALR